MCFGFQNFEGIGRLASDDKERDGRYHLGCRLAGAISLRWTLPIFLSEGIHEEGISKENVI